MNGGYDEGYLACPCFWGDQPGSLVSQLLADRDVAGWQVLDLGCGEGRNAVAFAKAGASVTAIDCSEIAITRGKQADIGLPIEWLVGDAANFPERPYKYDLVIMYGLLHCIPTASSVSTLIQRACRATRQSGIHLTVAFNDQDHDFERAHPGFNPTLLSHYFYLNAYSDHRILSATNTILREAHPHNGISHHHSMTRLVVEMQ